MDIESVIHAIDTDLPRLAQTTIAAHLDLSEPMNRKFLLEPDGREEHQTHWHQWGIITHTRVFLAALDDQVPALLQQWGLGDIVAALEHETIGGASRWELLHVAVLLHDIGKFATRTHSVTGFHFPRHERLSGEIARHEVNLPAYGLSNEQCEYIAETAADHFVLGWMRRRAREQGVFDLGYTRSPEFANLCEEIRALHPTDYREIGVLFLGDSLAKIDPNLGPAQALNQHEINLEVARRYLEAVTDCPSI